MKGLCLFWLLPVWLSPSLHAHEISLQKQLSFFEKNYCLGKKSIHDEYYDDLLRSEELTSIPHSSLTCENFMPSAGGKQKVAHAAYMGSIRKENKEIAIQSFMQKVQQQSECILQPKIDGVAIELVYERGVLRHASTRGNGWQGISIMELINVTPAIPKKILAKNNQPIPNLIILHGELYLNRKLAGHLIKDYRHARQKVAGLITQKSPNIQWSACLHFFPWLWVNSPYETFTEDNQQLENWGLMDKQVATHKVQTVTEVANWRNTYQQEKEVSPLLMDGVVIKANKKKFVAAEQHKLLPSYIMAWKFPPQHAAVKVNDIHWHIGKTGKQTAVLHFAPIELGGKTVRKVSGGGKRNMEKLAIKTGDIVGIALKGQAIPVLDRVLVHHLTTNQ